MVKNLCLKFVRKGTFLVHSASVIFVVPFFWCMLTFEKLPGEDGQTPIGVGSGIVTFFLVHVNFREASW